MPNVKSVSIVEGKLYVEYCGDTKPPEVFDIPCGCDPVSDPGDTPPITTDLPSPACSWAWACVTAVAGIVNTLTASNLHSYVPFLWETNFHAAFYTTAKLTDSSFVGMQHMVRMTAQAGNLDNVRLMIDSGNWRYEEWRCCIRENIGEDAELTGENKQLIASCIRNLPFVSADSTAFTDFIAGVFEAISVSDLRKKTFDVMQGNLSYYASRICDCAADACADPEAWIMTTAQSEAWDTLTGRLSDFPVSSTILNANTANRRVESVITSRGWENAAGPCTPENCDGAGIYHRFDNPITLCGAQAYVMMYLAADPSLTPHVGNSTGLALLYSSHIGTGEPPKSSWVLLTDIVVPYPTPVPRNIQYIGADVANVTAIAVIALHGGSYQAITSVSINQ